MTDSAPTVPPSRRSPLGANPPGNVRAPGAILRVDGVGAPAAQVVRRDGSIDMLPIGPDSWLAVSDRPPGEVRHAVTAVAGDTVACTDLTHARVVFRVAGPDARLRLARGCPMDLDTVESGSAAATMLGPFEVVIRRDREPDTYDVFVARSVARSARNWLRHASDASESGGT